MAADTCTILHYRQGATCETAVLVDSSVGFSPEYTFSKGIRFNPACTCPSLALNVLPVIELVENMHLKWENITAIWVRMPHTINESIGELSRVLCCCCRKVEPCHAAKYPAGIALQQEIWHCTQTVNLNMEVELLTVFDTYKQLFSAVLPLGHGPVLMPRELSEYQLHALNKLLSL